MTMRITVIKCYLNKRQFYYQYQLLPFFWCLSPWFCNFHKTLRFDKVKRSSELLRWKCGVFGLSLRNFCRSNFKESVKKILVSFTSGFAIQIFGLPRFSTITILFSNCFGPLNTRRIWTLAAKILLSRENPENKNKTYYWYTFGWIIHHVIMQICFFETIYFSSKL